MAATTILKKKQILWLLCKLPSLRMFEKKRQKYLCNSYKKKIWNEKLNKFYVISEKWDCLFQELRRYCGQTRGIKYICTDNLNIQYLNPVPRVIGEIKIVAFWLLRPWFVSEVGQLRKKKPTIFLWGSVNLEASECCLNSLTDLKIFLFSKRDVFCWNWYAK